MSCVLDKTWNQQLKDPFECKFYFDKKNTFYNENVHISHYYRTNPATKDPPSTAKVKPVMNEATVLSAK